MADEPMGRYLEDFVHGEVFVTAQRAVTEDDIRNFAAMTGDTNPLHVDAAYARRQGYLGLVASGNLGLSLALAMFDSLRLFHGTAIAALGIEQWRYHAPLVAGAVVRSRMTIENPRARRHVPGQGIVGRYIELLDAGDLVVQSGRSAILVRARNHAYEVSM